MRDGVGSFLRPVQAAAEIVNGLALTGMGLALPPEGLLQEGHLGFQDSDG